jgi:hypothetical protein
MKIPDGAYEEAALAGLSRLDALAPFLLFELAMRY